MTGAAQIAAAALAACFAWAAVAKLIHPARWRSSLGAYRLPPAVRAATVVAVPAVEGIAAALLMVYSRLGAALTIALLCVFSVAVLRARVERGGRLPCACFGGNGEREPRSMLARNTSLAVVAAVVLAGGGGSGALAGVSPPAAGDAVPALLSCVGLVLALWTARTTMAAFRR